MLDRRGRKRERDDERQDERQEQEAGEQQESSDVEVEELEVEGQASASSEPRPPSTSPPRGPPPRAPKFSPIPIDPPARWDPWSPEWFLYFMLGRVNRRLQRRGQVMDRNTLLRYNHRRDILEMQLGILDQNHSEGVRRRAHMMCRGMTDLSSVSQSSGGPEIAEEEEPENESIVEEQHLAAIQGRQVEMNSSEKSLIQVMDILPHQVCQGEVWLCPQQNKTNKTMRRTMTQKSRTARRSHTED